MVLHLTKSTDYSAEIMSGTVLNFTLMLKYVLYVEDLAVTFSNRNAFHYFSDMDGYPISFVFLLVKDTTTNKLFLMFLNALRPLILNKQKISKIIFLLQNILL